MSGPSFTIPHYNMPGKVFSSPLVTIPNGEEKRVVAIRSTEGSAYVWGVHVAPASPVTSDLLTVARSARGVVEWGAGNAVHRAEFDIINGASFNVFASALEVRAVNDGHDGFDSPVQMLGSIAWGGAAVLPLTRTFDLATVTSIGTTVSVPPFARNVVLYKTPDTEGINWRFETGGGEVVLSTGGAPASQSVVGPLMLPKDCGRVRILANPFGTLDRVQVVFQLNI